MAPIVIARIDTERSFFQMKDSVQQMVRGVIEAYWALVFARTDVWARRAAGRAGPSGLSSCAEARHGRGPGQRRRTWRRPGSRWPTSAPPDRRRGQRAAARGGAAQHPGPAAGRRRRLVPVTPPLDRAASNPIGTRSSDLAEQQRPDLIELKLILEADQQRLHHGQEPGPAAARRRRPCIAGTAWRGGCPTAASISRPGPIHRLAARRELLGAAGPAQARAGVRQQELIIMRDRANLERGCTTPPTSWPPSYRNLAQYYEQYLAFRETRDAGQDQPGGPDEPTTASAAARSISTCSRRSPTGATRSASEAQSLTPVQHRAGQSGAADGHDPRDARHPLCRRALRLDRAAGAHFAERCYPKDMHPTPNAEQYPTSTEPAPRTPSTSPTRSRPTRRQRRRPMHRPDFRRSRPPPPDLQFGPPPSPDPQSAPPPPTAPQTAPQRLQLEIPAYSPEAISTPWPNR